MFILTAQFPETSEKDGNSQLLLEFRKALDGEKGKHSRSKCPTVTCTVPGA